ncbi:DUF6544 family protein [Spirosoma utsteinense]|uniref:Uncharacterized protein n=1 Tax=Spirosoma utsteinense TaxID=2585773 RepID=A0ABR6WEL5_9BACT|nr:DUF6544 family protein [Spirosoma utsteinense]MBC3787990.1 hypothetical protein [Spirosoma utsteinense]MBC3794933.1 hypothetical protein [Spirosoma utsteinense]
MIRTLFACLLLVHGLIHLLGFISQWQLAKVSQMTGKSIVAIPESMAKLMGTLWLLACLGFLLATAGYWLRRDGWLAIALGSVILSQALIILFWPDARAGTIANLIITAVLLLTYTHNRFDWQTDQETRHLLGQSRSDKTATITSDSLMDLPAPVQQWLTRSGVVGKERIHTVRLRQHGRMRTTPGGRWMTAEAEQYFTVDQPGFIWKASIRLAPLVQLTGRDRYENGHGSMNIRLLSLIEVANARGPETDQGTLLRFLSEIIWFPSAALSPYIHWDALDSQSARATMHYGEVTASGIFRFTKQGDVSGFEAQRYMEKNGQYTLETWTTTGSTYRTLASGIRIPTEGAATWKLKTGDFTWYKLTIGSIDYNKPVLY